MTKPRSCMTQKQPAAAAPVRSRLPPSALTCVCDVCDVCCLCERAQRQGQRRGTLQIDRGMGGGGCIQQQHTHPQLLLLLLLLAVEQCWLGVLPWERPGRQQYRATPTLTACGRMRRLRAASTPSAANLQDEGGGRIAVTLCHMKAAALPWVAGSFRYVCWVPRTATPACPPTKNEPLTLCQPGGKTGCPSAGCLQAGRKGQQQQQWRVNLGINRGQRVVQRLSDSRPGTHRCSAHPRRPAARAGA